MFLMDRQPVAFKKHLSLGKFNCEASSRLVAPLLGWLTLLGWLPLLRELHLLGRQPSLVRNGLSIRWF